MQHVKVSDLVEGGRTLYTLHTGKAEMARARIERERWLWDTAVLRKAADGSLAR